MKVLIGCEHSGIVREAFRKRGHDAWSCDLLPCEDESLFHFQCDVREVINDGWDLAIFHPDCTYVCGSGLHWNHRREGRIFKTCEAVGFFRFLWNCKIPKIAIENPVGILSTLVCKPTQTIQPYQFGHDASKATCLWLKGLPKLEPTQFIAPRIVNGKKRWGNQTDSGQNKLPPSEDRWKLRAKTYEGIADAMAMQWGEYERWQTARGWTKTRLQKRNDGYVLPANAG